MISGRIFVSKAPSILIFSIEISHKFIMKLEASCPFEMLAHMSGVHKYRAPGRCGDWILYSGA